jgi:hypothetical protein
MEICLIFGDVFYAIFDEYSHRFLYLRLFFIICSVFNLLGVTCIMCKYQLWSISYKGHQEPHSLLRRRSTSRVDETSEMRRRSIDFSSSPEHLEGPPCGMDGILDTKDVENGEYGEYIEDGDDSDSLSVDSDEEMDETRSVADERVRRISVRMDSMTAAQLAQSMQLARTLSRTSSRSSSNGDVQAHTIAAKKEEGGTGGPDAMEVIRPGVSSLGLLDQV